MEKIDDNQSFYNNLLLEWMLRMAPICRAAHLKLYEANAQNYSW
jgi:hypothetical protein